MKKIMFDDRYGLTKAVLAGRKTMTRRLAKRVLVEDENMEYRWNGEFVAPRYKPDEVVAVAQSLRDMGYDPRDTKHKSGAIWGLDHTPAWTNKMFISASECIHRIRITGVRVERLQDISDEDCFKEGIYKKTLCPPGDIEYFYHSEPRSKREVYPSARDAFAGLIDKVSGKGTFDSNPWVFVYEFELVK